MGGAGRVEMGWIVREEKDEASTVAPIPSGLLVGGRLMMVPRILVVSGEWLGYSLPRVFEAHWDRLPRLGSQLCHFLSFMTLDTFLSFPDLSLLLHKSWENTCQSCGEDEMFTECRVPAESTPTPLPSLLRCLRGPHLLPLPLTPVGPEGPGLLRLSVPGSTWVEPVA